MFIIEAKKKVKYNRVISIHNLKKSLIRLTVNQKNCDYEQQSLSFKNLLQLNKMMQAQTYFVTNFSSSKTKNEFLNLLLLESLSQEINAIVETQFLPSSIGQKNISTIESSFFFIKKYLTKKQLMATLNITEKLTVKHEKKLYFILTDIMDKNSLVLTQTFIKTNYINFKYNFHKLSFLIKVFSYKEFVWSILSPLLINIFFHEFDKFLTKLGHYETTTAAQNGFSYSILPFLKKKRSTTTKINQFRNFRFLNFYLLCFPNDYKLINLIYKQIKKFLKIAYFIENISFLTFNKNQINFLGFLWAKDKDYQPIITEKELQTLLIEQKILKPKLNTNNFKILYAQWLLLATDTEIVDYFSLLIKKLFFFYKKINKPKILKKYFLLCRLSCALTLAEKYKLKNTQQVFKKFTKHLIVYNTKTKTKKRLFLPPFY